MTPFTIVARRLHKLIVGEREAIYHDLLEEERARHALETATAKAAVDAFTQLVNELGGSWQRQDQAVTWTIPDIDLKAKVAVAFGKDDRPHLVVHLGTVGKAIWVEPDSTTIANGVLACASELTANADWRRETAIQMRGAARAAACSVPVAVHSDAIPALPVPEPGPNGRVALALDAQGP